MNKTHAGGAVLLALVSAAAQGAHGGTIYSGKTVQFQYYAFGSPYDGFGSPTDFTAPSHVRFGPYFTVEVAGDKIIYTYREDVNWTRSIPSLRANRLHVRNGSVIYSTGGEFKIRGVQLDPASILIGSTFSADEVTFNARAVAVNWSNISFKAGDKVILDVSRSAPMSPGPKILRPISAPGARTPIPPPTANSTPPRR